MSRPGRSLSLWLGLALWSASAAVTQGEAPEAPQEHSEQEHSAHRRLADEERPRYKRTFETYRVPDLTLIDQKGREVKLASALEASTPVALNFVFTTCNTICPVMTATFSSVRQELGKAAEDLQMISISIDPEYDTQRVLEAYAERHQAGSGWQFLTGDKKNVVSVLKAFDAYTGSKMNHRPLTFFKVPGNPKWLRIEGLASASDLATEYRQLRKP